MRSPETRGGLTIGSLFSGIGGLELGLERGIGNGAHTVWHVEQSAYCRAVLAKHWPDAERFGDVRTVGAHNLSSVDVLCGGFPCQDVSAAGRRAGIVVGTRSGLWYEYSRIIRELRPRYVVVENVAALLTLGLDAVLGELAESGYDAEWDCLPASSVGAPHQRDRVFVLAYPQGDGQPERGAGHQGRNHPASRGQRLRVEPRRDCACTVSAAPTNADSDNGGQRRARRSLAVRAGESVAVGALPVLADTADGRQPGDDQHDDTESVHAGARGPDGARGWWAIEPGMGRVANGVPSRVDRLKALGNAVVPQVAEVVGRLIAQREADREVAA